MHIRIGDLTFHGGDLPGFTGFTVSSFEGWVDGPGQRRETSSRPGSAGAFDVAGFASDHVVSWGGRYHGSSLADVNYAGRVLSGLGAGGSRVQVVVDWEDSLWAWARVNRVRYSPAGAFPWADYQVELWMADPRKFGAVQQSVSTGGTVTAHHYGNYAATPQFTVAGTFPNGYALHALGRVVQVAAGAGAVTDRVDFRTGMVTRNNTLNPTLLQQGQFWTVAGGASVSWRLDPLGGAGTATCSLTDTFV